MLAASIVATTAIVAPAMAAPKVVASIKPVHSLAAAVMDGVATPQLLLGAGASPHGASLKPSQATALQDADVVFWIGPDLESFLEAPMATIAADARSVELEHAPGVTVLAPREGGTFDLHDDGDEADHADGHEEVDPHMWLDPANARAFVAAMADALSAVDPENAAKYAENAEAEIARLDELQAQLAQRLAPLAGKPFIVFHDAYHYFENRFGIEAAGSVTVSPELAPGAERVAEIRQRIAEAGATCVFTEPQFPPRLVATIIEGTDARTGALDPLGSDLPDGPDLYPALLTGLADNLEKCLSR